MSHKLQIVVLLIGFIIYSLPTPQGLTPEAWHLFAIFITTILAVILKAVPIFTSSIIAISATIMTDTLSSEQAFSGFSQDFILLIVIAFLMSVFYLNLFFTLRLGLEIIAPFLALLTVYFMFNFVPFIVVCNVAD